MPKTSARLILLLSLLQSRPEWPVPELIERLQVSGRTVRRDVDRLRELGYPIEVTLGRGSTYRLAPGSELPPLLFDDEQAIAVALALQLAPSTVTGFGESAARALTTIRQLIPPRLRYRIDSLQITAVDNIWDFTPSSVDSTSLTTVGVAILEREVLRFDYLPSPTGQATEAGPPRRVEPHHLVVWSGRWYVIAWNLDRHGWQTLRVDRIDTKMRTHQHFTPRTLPTTDIAEYVRTQVDRGDTTDDRACQGEVILHTSAEHVARWAPSGAVVETLGPGRCRLTMGAWSWPVLAAFYGVFDADMDVIGPPELINAFAHLAPRYTAAGTAK